MRKQRFSINGEEQLISFAILDYKWKEYHKRTSTWKICSDGQSVGYETKYNKNHLNSNAEITLDGKRLGRFSRFEGKVIRLNKLDDKTIGYVKHGGRSSVPFE
eukprot:94257_1